MANQNQKKISIELLGNPKSSFYNFGTQEKPEWRKAGDVVEVDEAVARRMVLNRQAAFTDSRMQLEKVQELKPISDTIPGVQMDQDVPATEENN